MNKSKLKNYLKLGVLIIGISTLNINCSNEQLEVEYLQEINPFEENFSLDNFNDPTNTIKGNINIDWNDYSITAIQKNSFYEFKINTKNKTVLNTELSSSKYVFRLITFQKNEVFNYYLAKFLPFRKTVTDFETISYFNMLEYSGMVYLYNMNGDIELTEIYFNGELTNQLVHQESIFANSNIKTARCVTPEQRLGEDNSGCFFGANSRGGYWQEIITDHYTDWYQLIDTVGGYEIYQWTSEQYNGSTSTFVWVEDPNYNPDFYNIQTIGSYTNTATNGTDITANNVIITTIPPSCKSFEFEKVGDNWQASLVQGIQFGVATYTVNPINLTIYRIRDYIDSPILFGTWEEDRFGNTIDAGTAAELAAEALNEAIKGTAHHFKDKYGFNETQVRLWFEDKLKNEFQQITDGGRITFRNNRYNQNPTDYKTTLFGSDNCN